MYKALAKGIWTQILMNSSPILRPLHYNNRLYYHTETYVKLLYSFLIRLWKCNFLFFWKMRKQRLISDNLLVVLIVVISLSVFWFSLCSMVISLCYVYTHRVHRITAWLVSAGIADKWCSEREIRGGLPFRSALSYYGDSTRVNAYVLTWYPGSRPILFSSKNPQITFSHT